MTKHNKRTGLMWSPINDRIIRDLWLDRLPSTFFDDDANSNWASSALSEIRSNIWENESHYGIEIAIPAGIDPKEIDLDLKDDMLTVKAEISEESTEDNKRYHHKQIVFGSFIQSFNLPAGIDLENVSAKHNKGILQIVFPKLETRKSKKIQIMD